MKRPSLPWFLLAFAALHTCASQAQQETGSHGTPAASDSDSEVAAKQTEVDSYFHESSELTSSAGPQVITRSVRQDSSGRFWFATWGGIVRYDGTKFTNITNQAGLRRYRAFSLFEDDQNNVWIGTCGAGVYRYDGNTYTNFTKKDGFVDDTVLSIMQDRDHNLWFGGLGLTKYDGTTFTSFTKEDGFTNADVNSISQAPDGTLWLGTRGALFRYDGDTFVNFTEEQGLAIDSYIPTLIDRRGHLWFSGQNGLYHYDGKRVKHLFESTCLSLMEDSHGNIWFTGVVDEGTSPRQGMSLLNRFDPTAGIENIRTASEQIEVKAGRGIFELFEDKQGGIWFGSGRGVGRIDGNTVRYF
jgi:ligand-binding sensor domain-containing protein